MSEPSIEAKLAQLIRDSYDLLRSAAVRFNQSQYTPEQQKDYSDADIDQMLKGLSGTMLEALEGTGSQVRTMILESMIPGLIATGENPATMAHWVSGYMTLLSCELVRKLDATDQAAAIDWLSDFTAHYTADTVHAAMEAMANAKG